MALTTTPSELTATALTLTTAAQPNITSVGTLTTLTVDNLGINGNTITANSGALNLTPASGSAIVLDGTINVDAGVVTGATSITSTAFVGGLTGNVTGNASGTALTVTQAAQSAITSVGTLTGLQVDGGVTVNGAHINIDAGMSFQWDNSHERIEQSDGKIEFFTNNGEQMTLSGSNLGIGTTSPDRTVSIKHASQAEIGFKTGSVSNGALIYYNDSEDKLLIRAQESGDHIAFQTGGTTERMRIDSSGNVGINSSATRIYTASFGSSDNVKHLTVKSASGSVLELVGSSNSHQVGMGAIQFVNDANDNNTANAGGKELALIMVQTETSDTNTSSDSGGVLRIFTKPEAGTTAERMRIDSAGKVGIGGASAGDHLHVQDVSSSCNVRISGEGNINRKVQIGYDASVGPYIQAGSSGIATLRVYVDNTSYVSKFDSNGDFYSNDGTVHNLSDVRVKKDIAHLTDGLEIVKQLKPRTYKYTEDSEMYNEKSKDEVRYGFIANEVEEVAPQYTKTGKGKVGDEEVEDFKSLSATKMIPMLVKALQEALTRIEALEAK